MFYLPLDKLLEKSQRAIAARPRPTSRTTQRSARAQKEPDSVTVEARGRGDR